MNEAILNIVQGNERLYPHELEKRYARVMNKIVELWETPEIDEYLLDLMVDRRGDRQGFPSEVAQEIYHLSLILEKTRKQPAEEEANPWANIDIKKQAEIEGKGYPFNAHGFLKSAENGDLRAVSLFLGSNINVDTRDERGWTPLTISAFNGNEDIARLLIQAGADLQATDNAGYGPMHWAAFNGYASVVKLLIEKLADVNARSQHGWTPLLQAATRGHLSVCSALIAAGADVNLSSNDGWTPLHKSCANGHTEVVRLLLSVRANPHVEYQDGVTPLFLAQKNKQHEIVALLSNN